MPSRADLPRGPRISLLAFGSVYRNLPEHLTRWHGEYGDGFTIRPPLGPPIVVLTHPEQVRWVFENQDQFDIAPRQNPFTKLFGKRSSMVLNGEEHADFRARTAAIFSPGALRAFAERAVVLTRDFPNTTDTGAFSLYERLREATLRVIVAWIFGEDEDRSKEFRAAVGVMSSHFARHPLLSLPPLQFRLGPLTPWSRFLKLRKRVLEGIDDAIARAARLPDEAVLKKMIQAGFRGDELRDNILTFLMAGHETSAGQAAWCFRYLLQDPALLDELAGEITERDFAHAALESPLLDSVLHEVFRLRPVIPFISRVCARDLRMGAYVFPAGTFLMLPVHLTHLHPAVYDNPEQFQPRRFMNRRPQAFEWYPFGAGVKRCPGLHFAFMEIKIIIARYLARRDLVLVEKQSFEPTRRGVAILPRDGVLVRARSFA